MALLEESNGSDRTWFVVTIFLELDDDVLELVKYVRTFLVSFLVFL